MGTHAGSDAESVVSYAPLLPAGFLVVLGALHTLTSPGAPVLTVFLAWFPSVLLLGVGWAVRRSRVSPDHYPRMLGWGAVGAGVVGFVMVVLILTPGIEIDSVGSMIAGVGIGVFGGLMAGFNEARAIERGRQAERERQAAERATAENARLEHLNHLLRHDIRNNATVISGHADLLLEGFDDSEVSDHARIIRRQANSIEELITNVRSYIQSVDQQRPLHDVDLSAELAAEVEALEQSFPDVALSADVPEGVTVRGDALLGSVFSNLLRNAVVHNRGDAPEIAVSVARDGETVTVRIEDDGPGIPDSVLDDLERPPERRAHGFGLYLVQTLVSRYGGTLTIDGVDGEGTTVTVTLRRAGEPSRSNGERAASTVTADPRDTA